MVDENRTAGVAKRALARRHGKEVNRASEVLALGADRLGRGVAQINKRRLLGPELSPKQEHGVYAFFSYAEPPQTKSSALTFLILDHLGLRSSYLVFTHAGCSRVRGEHGDIVRIDVAHGHYEGGRLPEEQNEPTANTRRAVSCLRGKTHARAPPQTFACQQGIVT